MSVSLLFYCFCFCLCCLVYFMVQGFELRVLHLLLKPHPLSLLKLVIFWTGSCAFFPRLTLDHDPSTKTLLLPKITVVSHHTQLFVEMGFQ
jgi:hypothetical protein